MTLCSCRKRTMAKIRDLIKESLQLSANLLSLVTLDNAIENHIRRITFLKSFFAQIVYEFDLPADFVRGIHEVDNFLSNKINELERRFDMIGTCKQGRSKYEIHRLELEGLRDLGFTWKKIAKILCVSESTLRTKRHEFEITDKYTGMKDNDLHNFVQEILEESRNIREKMPQGALQSRGVRIQWRSLRSSIERVDPTGKVLQHLRTLRRRKYQVEGPNVLWLVFFHPSFHYRIYFQIRFLSTKRFKKSLYP